MSKYADENVLVITRELFDQLGSFQGISLEPDQYLPTMLDPANNHFLARDLAEDDPSHKQIIPYAIFRYGDKFLHYVRGGKSGEKRLAAKGSIGIGGHINDTDYAASSLDRDTYTVGVEREIDEELNITGGHTQEVLGLINDDSNEVGQVHLGVVHLFNLNSDEVTPGEDNIENLEFLTLEELQARRDALETWSQICVDGLAELWRDK
ncbi:MAG: NUDIX domain-containing protein [Verrucomicrobiota bacterium]